MRPAISNIAWKHEDDAAAVRLAAELGFEGIEVAPAKVFGPLLEAPLASVRGYRRWLQDHGLAAPAMQGLLFGETGVHLFASPDGRARMAKVLAAVAAIAGELGAGACVFGAPALRDPGDLSLAEAYAVAIPFFQEMADVFRAHGTSLSFEANPPAYNCRFVTHTREAYDLVQAVGKEGFALQLDTSTLLINEEPLDALDLLVSKVAHAHLSEPSLSPIGQAHVDHKRLGRALARSGYGGWLAVEMRTVEDWRGAMIQAHEILNRFYLDRDPA